MTNALVKLGPKLFATPTGGLAVQLTNKTGSATVLGQSVDASSAADDAFDTCASDDIDSIGTVYPAGIADGEEALVVVGGIADFLLKDGTASTRGNWINSADAAGRTDMTATPPAGGLLQDHEDHFREQGHCLQSVTSGTSKTARGIVHHN